MDDLAKQLLDKATVVHLKPDDVLLIGNAGRLLEGDASKAREALQELMPNRHCIMFAEDITVDLLRDTCPYCTRPEGYDACPIHRDHP